MNYMSLFTKIERDLAQVERSDHTLATLSSILRRLVDDFGAELSIEGGRIYLRHGDRLVLSDEYPPRDGHLGLHIPLTYAPVRELLENGFVFHRLSDPGIDPQIEERLGVRTFAAIAVGNVNPDVIAFSVGEAPDRDRLVSTLNTIRHVINLKLSQQRLESRVAEVREIQLSLLPQTAPAFDGYDVWGTTRPAEEVGGDLYDFLVLSERSLGIAIADSAGHGLPAALQARDAIIGLRMGVEEQLRITATVAKLNRVISRAALSSRFISLFYCEVEPNGNLVYCNAGHNAPLLRRGDELHELTAGGMVLGPNPHARYERGYMQMTAGAVLLLYTDGIVEAENGEGEMFGRERLAALVRGWDGGGARALVDAVFAAVRGFAATDPPRDDQTVVAVIRR